MTREISLEELNKHLVCSICDGYYRDAYTICECLHTFCRQCLYDHFCSTNKAAKFCPECSIALGVKPKVVYDINLQSCVDKLFPEFLLKDQEEAQKRDMQTDSDRKRRNNFSSASDEQEHSSKNRKIGGSPSTSSGGSSGSRSRGGSYDGHITIDASNNDDITGTSGTTNTSSDAGTKAFPNVIVSVSIEPSAEQNITAENTPVITLLVPMNSTTAALQGFIRRKYKKDNHRIFGERLWEKLEYFCGNTRLESATPLTKVAFANGYQGEEDSATNRATVKGLWMTLAIQGKWVR